MYLKRCLSLHLHILGSSARKPVPRPFCSCRVCQTAVRFGGRDARTRTTVQLYPRTSWCRQDDVKRPEYQFDMSPDLTHQMIREKIDISSLKHLFFTHTDSDHCSPESLSFRGTIRSPLADLAPLTIYGNEAVHRKVNARVKDLSAVRADFQVISDGESLTAGDIKVTAFRSIHGGKDGCLHYAVDDGEHKALLAWDGPWEEEVWKRLESWTFDALLMECVHMGPAEKPLGGHLTFDSFVSTKNRLIEQGTLREDSLVVAVHIGDNGGLTYEEAQEMCSSYGITVGYDGLVVEVK